MSKEAINDMDKCFSFAEREISSLPSGRPHCARRTLIDILIGFVLATVFWTALPPVLRLAVEHGHSRVGHHSKHRDHFPNGSKVGFAGPTPTGKEPFAAATAPAQPSFQSYFPLVHTPSSKNSSFDILRSWGTLSPFHSLAPETFGLTEATPDVPSECSIEQVHLIHRHGARYPLANGEPKAVIRRFKAAKGFKGSGAMSFLNGFEDPLGAEILTPFGRNQLFSLGVGFRQKYGKLLNKAKKKLVFRTTSQDRMLKSGLNFAAGFWGIPYKDQYHNSISIEGIGFNNSLAPYHICPRAKDAPESFVGPLLANWTNIYLADAVTRLQANVEGYTLTTEDLQSMQQLCAYETVSLGWSAFCSLFTEEEWKNFEYWWDLYFWYSSAFGNPVGASLGMGWVQELVARLAREPISLQKYATNGTLDSNPVTFPLDQPVYVDATHDAVIAPIVVALNFTSLAKAGPLPTTYRPDAASRTFFSAQIVPFAANLQAQVLSCGGMDKIRFLLNDAPIPLEGVQGCGVDGQGLCEKGVFIATMKKRIEEVDFAYDCHGKWEYQAPSGGGGITNGQAPRS